VIDDCVDFVVNKATQIKDVSTRKELIAMFIGNYANVLKIDQDSLEYDSNLLEQDKNMLDSYTNMFLDLLSSEERQYATEVFARLGKGDRLIRGSFITVPSGQFAPSQDVFVPDKREKSLYKSIIGSKTPVDAEAYPWM
jgi:hypothetical protein